MVALATRFTAIYEKSAEMVKDYFLYLKSNNTKIAESDIYCFSNRQLVAIDTSKYDTKEKRLAVCHKYYLSTFNVASPLFVEIVRSILSDERFCLKDLAFDEEDFDYEDEIREAIDQQDKYILMKTLNYVINNTGIDILDIIFTFEGNLYTLTDEGIIHTAASEEKFLCFVSDKKISDLIIGRKNSL